MFNLHKILKGEISDSNPDIQELIDCLSSDEELTGEHPMFQFFFELMSIAKINSQRYISVIFAICNFNKKITPCSVRITGKDVGFGENYERLVKELEDVVFITISRNCDMLSFLFYYEEDATLFKLSSEHDIKTRPISEKWTELLYLLRDKGVIKDIDYDFLGYVSNALEEDRETASLLSFDYLL